MLPWGRQVTAGAGLRLKPAPGVQVLPDPNMVIIRLNSKSLCGDKTGGGKSRPKVRPAGNAGDPSFLGVTLSPGAILPYKRDGLAITR